MKPLNKLEKEMFEAMTGRNYDAVSRSTSVIPDSLFYHELNARAAAKVAVDLARRTWEQQTKNMFSSNSTEAFMKFEDFLKTHI